MRTAPGWLDDWLDLVLGAACVCCASPGRLVCDDCRDLLPTEAHRVWPQPCPDGLAPAYAATQYADPVRRMILLHKERHVFALARPLGLMLAASIRSSPAPAGRRLLVPVPSRPGVVRARGHDPMLRTAREAARFLGGTRSDVVVTRLLRQRGAVADQAGLTAAERAANLADRMAVHPGLLRRLARSGADVTAIVCDDVLTTGATAREAQRALEAVGVPVAAICCVAATRKLTSLPK